MDLKGFTPLSESIPAFDLVYILNRYFTALKEEFVKNHGTINLWVDDESRGEPRTVDDLRFGLVGDCVNVASRIERKTRDFNCDILISQDVWDNLKESRDLFQEKHEVPLKGVSQAMTVYPSIRQPPPQGDAAPAPA